MSSPNSAKMTSSTFNVAILLKCLITFYNVNKLITKTGCSTFKHMSQCSKIVKDNRVVYGITTGFGKFARTIIEKEKLHELQNNLIRSHAAGVGRALSPEKTRMLLALRINVLAKVNLNHTYFRC